jgi:hypothetical protein
MSEMSAEELKDKKAGEVAKRIYKWLQEAHTRMELYRVLLAGQHEAIASLSARVEMLEQRLNDGKHSRD